MEVPSIKSMGLHLAMPKDILNGSIIQFGAANLKNWKFCKISNSNKKVGQRKKW